MNNANNMDLQFGLSLLSLAGKGNQSVSPASIRTAMSMLYEGAKGKTAKEITKAAFIPESAADRKNSFKNLTELLNVKTESMSLNFANAFFLADNLDYNKDFVAALRDNYASEMYLADFTNNPEGERKEINDWVAKNTQDKIKDLLPQGSIDSYTSLVLANALYFKAKWHKAFDKKNTTKEAFALDGDKKTDVDMMKKNNLMAMYTEMDGIQAVLLHYEGKELGKLVLLPPQGSSLNKLSDYLVEKRTGFQDIYSRMQERKISTLKLPKHTIEAEYDLGSMLQKMGVNEAFSTNADLSGIAKEPLGVGAAVHKTYFKTDEEGSEGAAATAIVTYRLCARISHDPIINFIADRPFMEAVVHYKTGSMLFLNKVEDPR